MSIVHAAAANRRSATVADLAAVLAAESAVSHQSRRSFSRQAAGHWGGQMAIRGGHGGVAEGAAEGTAVEESSLTSRVAQEDGTPERGLSLLP